MNRRTARAHRRVSNLIAFDGILLVGVVVVVAGLAANEYFTALTELFTSIVPTLGAH
jgi:hypothetical protein